MKKIWKYLKKKLFAIVFLGILMQGEVSAQITLQFTFDTSFVATPYYCTDIGNNDFKFIFTNFATNSFSIYNIDMSPYITNIHIPSADSMKNGYSVMYVTKSLFDCDSTNIEYIYENPLGGEFSVFRTDGTVLLQVDSARGPYDYGGFYGGSYDLRPIVNTNAGAKLFLFHQVALHASDVLVYSLCSNLPEDVYGFSKHNSFVKISPNPANMQLNFEINPPNNMEEFQLLITDANAKEVNREDMTLLNNKYTLDVSNYSSGGYMYSLISKNRVYQSGKFIITK